MDVNITWLRWNGRKCGAVNVYIYMYIGGPAFPGQLRITTHLVHNLLQQSMCSYILMPPHHLYAFPPPYCLYTWLSTQVISVSALTVSIYTSKFLHNKVSAPSYRLCSIESRHTFDLWLFMSNTVVSACQCLCFLVSWHNQEHSALGISRLGVLQRKLSWKW